jgi:formylmethanofuran dehydrogenase subunit C
VSEDTLISTILNAKKATLAELVTAGKLTQAQVDLMIQNMTARVKTMVERTDVGPAFSQGGAGIHMGQGMRGGRWNRS